MNDEVKEVKKLTSDIRGVSNSTSGRMGDLYFEDDPHTSNAIMVWADDHMYEVIRSVEGVMSVDQYLDTNYRVSYDLRYDRGAIKRNISAAVKKAMDERAASEKK